jgi:hypothetical protein
MEQAVLNDRFILFVAVWGALALAVIVFFKRTKDVKRKQAAVAWFAGTFGLLFIAMTQFLGLPPEALFLVVPMVVFITWTNVRAVRFCVGCGAYNLSSAAMKVKFCRSCGQSLEKRAL